MENSSHSWPVPLSRETHHFTSACRCAKISFTPRVAVPLCLRLRKEIQGRRKYCRSKIHALASAENIWFGCFFFASSFLCQQIPASTPNSKKISILKQENIYPGRLSIYVHFPCTLFSRYGWDKGGGNKQHDRRKWGQPVGCIA